SLKSCEASSSTKANNSRWRAPAACSHSAPYSAPRLTGRSGAGWAGAATASAAASVAEAGSDMANSGTVGGIGRRGSRCGIEKRYLPRDGLAYVIGKEHADAEQTHRQSLAPVGLGEQPQTHRVVGRAPDAFGGGAAEVGEAHLDEGLVHRRAVARALEAAVKIL